MPVSYNNNCYYFVNPMGIHKKRMHNEIPYWQGHHTKITLHTFRLVTRMQIR